NQWHIDTGGQILPVIGGRGDYQQEGKQAQQLHPGNVGQIPPGTNHWHGVAPYSGSVHLAIEANSEKGTSKMA
ncbi:MAG: cupin domain-containing protein, partial [Nitrososphaerales archaeon]